MEKEEKAGREGQRSILRARRHDKNNPKRRENGRKQNHWRRIEKRKAIWLSGNERQSTTSDGQARANTRKRKKGTGRKEKKNQANITALNLAARGPPSRQGKRNGEEALESMRGERLS